MPLAGTAPKSLAPVRLGRRLVVVPLLQDVGGTREIDQRRRKCLVEMDADLVAVERLDVLDPRQIGEVEGAMVLVDDEVEGIGDIVGIQLLAGMEFHALADVHVERRRVFPLPGGRQQRLRRILFVEVDQAVIKQRADDHHLAGVEIARVRDRVLAVGGPDQRVILFTSFGGPGRGQGQGCDQEQSAHEVRLLVFGAAADPPAKMACSGRGFHQRPSEGKRRNTLRVLNRQPSSDYSNRKPLRLTKAPKSARSDSAYWRALSSLQP